MRNENKASMKGMSKAGAKSAGAGTVRSIEEKGKKAGSSTSAGISFPTFPGHPDKSKVRG